MAETSVLLTGKMYDRVKNSVLIVIPAVSTLYFSLGAIWGLPAVDEVVKTLAALAAFLGALIGLSKRSYDRSDAKYDGVLVVDETDPERDVYSIEPFGDPVEAVKTKGEFLLKVMPPPS
jgi:hypothetical protein